MVRLRMFDSTMGYNGTVDKDRACNEWAQCALTSTRLCPTPGRLLAEILIVMERNVKFIIRN